MIINKLKNISRNIRYSLAISFPSLMKPIFYSKFNKMLFPEIDVKLIPEVELFFINDFIEKDSVVFDIGSNEGLYLLLFESAQKYNKIYGFEPIPVLNKRLKGFFPNLSIFDFAISNQTNIGKFKVPLINDKRYDTRGTLENFEEVNETGQNVFEVKTISMDDFVEKYKIENLGGIKIDVEGHELKAIQGGLNTLKKFRPFLMIEIEQRHHADLKIESIFEEVLNCGYQGFFFDPIEVKFFPIANFDYEKHQNRKNCYINNFLFFNIDLNLQNLFLEIENKYSSALKK